MKKSLIIIFLFLFNFKLFADSSSQYLCVSNQISGFNWKENKINKIDTTYSQKYIFSNTDEKYCEYNGSNKIPNIKLDDGVESNGACYNFRYFEDESILTKTSGSSYCVEVYKKDLNNRKLLRIGCDFSSSSFTMDSSSGNYILTEIQTDFSYLMNKSQAYVSVGQCTKLN